MTGGIEYGFMSFTTDMGRVAEETARKRREVEEAERKRREAEHVDGDPDDHEHADGDRDNHQHLDVSHNNDHHNDHHATRRAFLRDDASASEGRQQESASATYERARKDAAPHAQEPSSETMGGAEVPERGMDQVALV